jgi:hypothetical protein
LERAELAAQDLLMLLAAEHPQQEIDRFLEDHLDLPIQPINLLFTDFMQEEEVLEHLEQHLVVEVAPL